MSFFEENEVSIDTNPRGRVEGVYKVTGSGKYAAEYSVENVCHAVYAVSKIPSGRIKSMDVANAQKVQGVLTIITHENKETVPGLSSVEKIKKSNIGLAVFHTDQIYFKGQPIALVVAETLENATYAASLVEAEYERYSFEVDFSNALKNIKLEEVDSERGTTEVWKNSKHIIDQEYTIAGEVHHPMEMHATIAEWISPNKLKLYDKNQGVNRVQEFMGNLFELSPENIEIFSEFVGGGFGSGLRIWFNPVAATMAAKKVKRPVKLMVTRQQMFSLAGYRPASWQRIVLGSDDNGFVHGILHQAANVTSTYEVFKENITRVTRLLYHFPNLRTEATVVPLNLSTPTWMRGPGDCTGDFAVEVALDELSYKLKMDPLELRMRNFALEKHPESKLPWSSNFVDECVVRGAEMIGWENRKSEIGAIKEGDWAIGYGMGVGAWNAGRSEASAAMILSKNGSLTVQTAMTDIGTGTGTGMVNMTHDHTGIPIENIKIELGHSSLPKAPTQGGSRGLSSLSGAIAETAKLLKLKLIELAIGIDSKFKEANPEDLKLTETEIQLGNEKVSYQAIWEKNKLETIRVEGTSGPGKEREKFGFLVSAAHFTRLKVNTKTGIVKIDKYVCVADGGSIVNPKPAANQMSGAVFGGIGMTLMEYQSIDKKLGGLISDDLAGYHFAVNADAPIVEIEFINKPDPTINPAGAKGLGEVGIIGSAAAISCAIYNATGKRFRDLPITPEKILMG